MLSVLISVDKFSTTNPFAVANGVFQITFTSKEYIEIQKSPKVIIAKSNSAPYEALKQFMEGRGYALSENEQRGAMNTFINNETDEIEHVFFSVNKYYSLWVWKN